MDPFFTQADWCLMIERPQCILPVRNQLSTEACYAFAVTATMFGDEMARGDRSSLLGSTQEFLDYIHLFKRPRSAKGLKPFDVPKKGYATGFTTAFTYAVVHGVSPDRIYPWLGKVTTPRHVDGPWDGIVTYNGHTIKHEEKIHITGYEKLHTEQQVLQMLHNQPVTGAIYMPENFRNWKTKDILLVEGNLDEGQHAVTVIGYGREDRKNYYICQNSYGDDWGYKGYFRVLRHLVKSHYIPISTRSPGNA